MYVYIELLRRICALEADEQRGAVQLPAQFAMLGSYDALYNAIGEFNSFDDLKKHFEKRQLDLPWQYDRQPLFLYTNDNSEHIMRLFSIDSNYASVPLVFSQFHIDKSLLAQHESLDEIIDIISKYIENLKTIITSSELEFSVFANFGVSDFVIVFRDSIIAHIIELIYHLRMNDVITETVNIKSICSYMAFPLEANRSLRKDAIQAWIEREKENNSNIGINTLYETNSYSKGVGAMLNASFQLGEWDFLIKLPQNDYDLIANHISQLIENAVSEDVNTYANSYTSVTMHLNNFQSTNADCTSFVQTFSPTPIDSIGKKLDEISRLLNSYPSVVENRHKEIIKTLSSVKASITGIINYVNRLCVGHYQDDIRAYVIRFVDLLPQVLASYRNQIETEVKMERPEQVRLLVNDLQSYNAEFITAFQHLFAVLSVTPHTFIETFGCNMRSLTASSKLLCAYQALVLNLAEAFPDQIFTDRQKLTMDIASHQMLILPYRKMQSTHKLLYPLSSPLFRLSTISLDYSTMFNIQPTLFMLIHECGHHVGPRLRQPRSVFIAQAVFRSLLYRYFGKFIESPLDEIVNYSFPHGVNDVTGENNPLSFGISKEDYHAQIVTTYSQPIKEVAINTICEYADQLASNFHGWFTKINEEQIQRDQVNHIAVINHFVSQLVQSLSESIELQLCFTDSKHHYGEFSNEALELAQYYLSKFHRDIYSILNDIARTVNILNGNTRTVARLQADYLLLSNVNGTLNNFTTAMTIGRLENDEMNLIISIFRDTFADLFAITILSCDMQNYINTIPALFCTQLNQIVTDPATLLRIMAVCTVAFNVDDIDSILEPLALPETTIAAIRNVWVSQLVHYPAKEPLIEYAKHCYKTLQEAVQKVEKDITISTIRDFFASNTTEVSFVFSLWKQLMVEGRK